MFERPLYFHNVTLLTADGPIGHSLRVKGKHIVGIDTPPRRKDCPVDGRGGVMIPGLINAHDHLELNTFKRLKYREVYPNCRHYIEDIRARFDDDPDLVNPRQQPLADRLLVSAMKNLLGGVTTVCHHNPLHNPLRRKYPIRVVKEYAFCHSFMIAADVAASYQKAKRNWPWIIHLAEGVDTEAKAEFDQLDRVGALQKNTVLVHGTGLTARQRQALIERGSGLVWCPGSNYFMFGRTACVQDLAQAGKLALGSDSRLTGERDLLGELHVAYKTGQLSAQALFATVTTQAARVLRLRRGGQGQIVLGGLADLVLLPPPSSAGSFSQLPNLGRSQLDLVMAGGKPLVGSPRLRAAFEACKISFAPVLVDQVEKIMPQKLAERLKLSSVQEPGLVVG